MFQMNGVVNWIINTLTIMPGLLVAISFHELAHGYMAYILGDNTAKARGRLTLDPLAHIDPIGFMMLIFVGFGWAKPVPVDYRNLKKRKRDVILVSLAGSGMNFILALVSGILLAVSMKLGLSALVSKIIFYGMQYNLVLGLFNLIPVPPLDGSKVLASLLPMKYEMKFYEYERYFYFALILLLITGGLGRILMPPLNWMMGGILNLAQTIVFF
jgi:Zn-dependent protease